MEPSKEVKEKPKIRTYTVRLPGSEGIEVIVEAEDVALEEAGDSDRPCVYHYNFFAGEVTVASFPINSVFYITSKP